MTQIQGLWWPDSVGQKWQHALMHVGSIEWAIAQCPQRRTAVQAGGNVGLWPRRLSDVFARVITFEPEPISCACLVRNVPAWVEVQPNALGAARGVCGIGRKSLGGHRIVEGDAIDMTTVDALDLQDLDFLQLDLEGYEWHALSGASETIARCRPLIQVELRNLTRRYEKSDDEVQSMLRDLGYRAVSRQQGSDVVFQVAA